MKQPLISIIVPVYKVENYLDRCVQSIVEQTYSNLEIILVDDGSPDNCGAMCDAWAEKDSRIKVIHKENGGGAQARNAGLDCATGEYIGFVDSDDYILPEMYEVLLGVLHSFDSEIAECGYCTFEADGIITGDAAEYTVRVFNTEQALFENIRDKVCRQLVWNKLYSRSILEDVRFVEGKLIDDEFFTYRALGNAERTAVTSRILYCYRQQADSIMHQTYSIKRLDVIDAKQERIVFVQENYPALASFARIDLLFSCLYMGQMSQKYLLKDERKKAFLQLNAARKRYPLTFIDKVNISGKQRMWMLLAEISFAYTCRLRNWLKIGI